MILYQHNHVTVFQSALYLTTSTVIETAHAILIVDPTWLPQEVSEIRRHVAQIRRGRSLYLLLTHSDWDHILAAGAFPDAHRIASRAFVDNADAHSIINQIVMFDDQWYLQRDYPVFYPEIEFVVDRDDTRIQQEDLCLRLFLAPGHTACSIFAVEESSGVLLAGDYLSDVEFPYIYHSSAFYEDSLSKITTLMKQKDLALLVPGHGHIAHTHVEINRRVEQSLRYIRTLRQFIRQHDQKAINRMIAQCPFPHVMSDYHQHNQQLMIRELALSSPQ